MRRRLRTSAATAALAVMLPLPALAQQAARTPAAQNQPLGISPTPSQNTPGQELRPADVATSAAAVNTGLFPSAGNYLLGNGIDVHGVLLDHAVSNADAGNTPGNTANLLIFRPSADFDLGKIAGITGASIHTSATFFLSKNDEPGIIAQTGGAVTGYQTTPILESSALTKLTYEQKLFNDRLDIEVGRANVHQYFFIPNSLDVFSYDSPVLYADADFNSIPYGVYMGRASYHLTSLWYLQAGAFADDYRDEVKTGWRLGSPRATGAQLLAELGYRSEFNTERYPANLELGAEWNTRSGYGNVKGTGNNATSRTTAANYPGGGVMFFQAAKVLYRSPTEPAPGVPPTNIQVYSQADVAVDHPQPFNLDLLVGVNFTGFVPFRPADIIGLQARGVQLSAVEADFETREHTLLNRGRTVQQPRSELQLEAMYQATLGPYATLTGYVQYYTHPDDYEVPFVNHVPSNGAIVGVSLKLALGPILGTSLKPF